MRVLILIITICIVILCTLLIDIVYYQGYNIYSLLNIYLPAFNNKLSNMFYSQYLQYPKYVSTAIIILIAGLFIAIILIIAFALRSKAARIGFGYF